MLRCTLVSAAFTLAALSPAQADPLNVKPGLWSITATVANPASMIPPEALAAMPPQARDQIMARIAQSSSPQTRTTCVTPEKLRDGLDLANQSHGECTQTVIAQTATQIELRAQCQRKTGGESVHITYTAIDPQTIHGTIDITRAGATDATHIQMNGKFLSDSCTDAQK